MTRTIVPASPGWYLARIVTDGKKSDGSWNDYMYYEPIIAWDVERRETSSEKIYHTIYPLTINGGPDESFHTPWAIKKPDGKYERPLDFACDTEADMLKELRTCKDHIEARLKQKAAEL
jgi:hypothetical protein